MTFRREYQRFIFVIAACMCALIAHGAEDDRTSEKRIGVAMRMIGHEVLLCLGDRESRVMPIEKIGDHYKIPFEFEFEFDPSDIISIVDHVMSETNIASNYLVEIEQCKSKDVVHSFEIGQATMIDMIACRGRFMPKDCYSILISIINSSSLDNGFLDLASDNYSSISSGAKESNFYKSTFLIIPLIFLMGFIGYFLNNKKASYIDPNLVIIGASQFDKKNMALSFENKRVELSAKEAELLTLLHTSANTPIERETILNKVWGDEGDYVGRTLDVFISKLRKKLEADVSVKIVNVRGVGYKLLMDDSK